MVCDRIGRPVGSMVIPATREECWWVWGLLFAGAGIGIQPSVGVNPGVNFGVNPHGNRPEKGTMARLGRAVRDCETYTAERSEGRCIDGVVPSPACASRQTSALTRGALGMALTQGDPRRCRLGSVRETGSNKLMMDKQEGPGV